MWRKKIPITQEVVYKNVSCVMWPSRSFSLSLSFLSVDYYYYYYYAFIHKNLVDSVKYPVNTGPVMSILARDRVRTKTVNFSTFCLCVCRYHTIRKKKKQDYLFAWKEKHLFGGKGYHSISSWRRWPMAPKHYVTRKKSMNKMLIHTNTHNFSPVIDTIFWICVFYHYMRLGRSLWYKAKTFYMFIYTFFLLH